MRNSFPANDNDQPSALSIETAEMIKPYKKTYEKLGIDLPLSFEKNRPA
jgi:hypothetical protein